MTRLEALFQKMDEAYDEKGEFFFDPIPFVKEYLAERDATLIGEAEEIEPFGYQDGATYEDTTFRAKDVIYGRNTLRLEQLRQTRKFDTEEVQR